MPIAKTFVSHHGGDLVEHVLPILRQVAPYGVRPWIDKQDLGNQIGLRLGEQLRQAIVGGDCSSVTLFLSKQSVKRYWIDQEVRWAKEQMDQGRLRILPIWLDPPGSFELPESLKDLLEYKEKKVLWLEPHKDKGYVEKYVRSMLESAGIGRDTQELTLHLGHRVEALDADIPPEWKDTPSIDLRMSPDTNHQAFSPTCEEWREIEDALRLIRKIASSVTKLNVCGKAPLGVGHIIGKIWEARHASRPFTLSTFNNQTGKVFSVDSDFYGTAMGFDPTTSVPAVRWTPEIVSASKGVIVFLAPSDKMDRFLKDVEAWNDSQPERYPILPVPFQRGDVEDYSTARGIVLDCVGSLCRIRSALPVGAPIFLITAYLLSIAPLVSFHLATLGPIHFFDEVKTLHSYRLATEIP